MNLFDVLALLLFIIGFFLLVLGLLPKIRSFVNQYKQTIKEQNNALERRKREEIKAAQKSLGKLGSRI